jgi:uncharacterized membrane protein
MATQTIVIMTPVEDALYNGGLFFPLLGAGVAGLVVFMAIMISVGHWMNTSGGRRIADWVTGGAALAAIVAAVLVFHKLAI